MVKKDKKIEIQLADAQVVVNGVKVEGYQLSIAKKVIGEIAELDSRFAYVKNEKVESFYTTLEQAVEKSIESYNLSH